MSIGNCVGICDNSLHSIIFVVFLLSLLEMSPAGVDSLSKAYLSCTPITRTDPGWFRIGPRIGENPKQRPSRSPDTNPEYPRTALCCLVKNNSPAQRLFYILVASQNGSLRQATQWASAHRSSQDIGASLPKRKDEEVYAERNDIKLPIRIKTF
jgi:hypothetical protein